MICGPKLFPGKQNRDVSRETSRLATPAILDTMQPMTESTPVCDYEDQVERAALRRLMPPRGRTLLDVGAGFGRLADEYRGYERVVLFDYSRSLLREAQQHLGGDPRYLYVAGNWYTMPFVAGLFDTLVQVRTLHHAAARSCCTPKASRTGISSRTIKGSVTNKVARIIPGTAKATLRFNAASSGANSPLRPKISSNI